MTFTNSMDNPRRRLFTSNGNKDTSFSSSPLPQSQTTQFRQPLGIKNNLDYWQKNTDQRGVTYYWDPFANHYYGMETIYVQRKPTSWRSEAPQRPAPFPLQIPSQTTHVKPRAQMNAIPPVKPIYQNVPNSTTIQKPTETTNTAGVVTNSPPNSQTDFASGLKRADALIWSVQTDPLRELRAQAATISSHGAKRTFARQKPRWGRFMQSFCCCVAAQTGNGKSSTPCHPSLLITQVHKNANTVNSPSDSNDDNLRVIAVSSPTVLTDGVSDI
ncbi:hypothetical protein DICVIV_09517 [Dictyocaulus viviparus]|uniref:Uncharacterized protein n=1 Tax=Dictyocaulus viviparus TaxID=29172 RepID=A0A0D8XIM9_DICVI|nr:hypothetical protein DICVIV_09517 [Dictyocaulus viviparus]